MITVKDFKPGKIVFYSSFGVDEICKLKLIKITKTRGRHFWFDAEIYDNMTLRMADSYNRIGSVHSYSNAFIYNSLEDLQAGEKAYINVQVDALKGFYRKLTGRELLEA